MSAEMMCLDTHMAHKSPEMFLESGSLIQHPVNYIYLILVAGAESQKKPSGYSMK